MQTVVTVKEATPATNDKPTDVIPVVNGQEIKRVPNPLGKDPIINAKVNKHAQIIKRPRVTVSKVPQPNGFSETRAPTTTNFDGGKAEGVATLADLRAEKTHREADSTV